MMPVASASNASVTILGAGVIGLTAALYAARRGLVVTVIDRQPERRNGCSFGNAGMIVPSHFLPLAAPGMVRLGLRWMRDPESPFYIRPRCDIGLLDWGWKFWRASTATRVAAAAPVLRDWGLLSRQEFAQLNSELDLGLVSQGLLMLCKETRTLEEEAHVAEQARALGMPAEVLDARATAARDPGVTMDVCGSVHYPRDAHLSPSKLVATLQAELQRLGVRFLWDTEVLGFATEGPQLKAVRTSHGEVAMEACVLASGVWSEAMARALNLKLPMQAGKGYSLTLAQPSELPTRCSICTEARVAVTPMEGALRFGGTMELSGLGECIDARRVRGIVRAATTYFPAFRREDFVKIRPWAGLRPVSPDGMPYVGRTRRWSNLLVATGHAMMGLSLAPATGRVIADLLTNEPTPLDLRLLDPDRFA